MAIAINGSGTVTGISVGGLPDGIVDNDMIANTTIAEGKLAAGVNAITNFDQWHVTADWTGSDTRTTVSSNWARCSNGSSGDLFEKLGTGMSESSGIFTFPTTGIWLIQSYGHCYDNASSSYISLFIYGTSDSFSSDDHLLSNPKASIHRESGNIYAGLGGATIFDCKNASTYKVKLQVQSEDNVVWQGHADRMDTGAIFIRLGDT
jgi:hypothetical protein